MPDREMLRRASEGDAGAWQALLDRHGPYALDLAQALLRRAGASGIQPEDLLQEVWTALLSDGGRGLKALDAQRGLRPYLTVMVMNAVRKHLRESGRRRAREQAHPALPPVGAPDEPLLQAESAEAMEAALSRLAPEEVLLLRWIYWDGLSYEQAARLAAIPPNSLGPLLSRLRERLGAILKSEKDARDRPVTG